MNSHFSQSAQRTQVGHRTTWILRWLVVLLLVAEAGAADRTWTGLGSDNLWSNNANWSSGQKPGAFDNAILGSTSVKNCTVDIGIDIQGLTITSAYTGTISGTQDLTIRGSTTQGGAAVSVRNLVLYGGLTRTGGTLAVSGGITCKSGTPAFTVNGTGLTTGTVWVEQGATVTFSTLQASGRVTNLGTLTLEGGAINSFNNGSTTVATAGLTVTGAMTVTGGGSANEGTMTVSAPLAWSNSDGNWSFINGKSFTTTAGGTLLVSGNNSEGLLLTGRGSATAAIGDSVTFSSTTDTSRLRMSTGSTTVNGAITLAGNQSIEVMDSGTATINGSLTLKATGTGIFTVQAGSSLTTNGDTTIGNGSLTNFGTLALNGNLAMGSGTFTNSGTLTIAATKTLDCRNIGLNQWTNTGTITENGIIRRWASGLAFTNSTGQSLTSVTPGNGIYITCLDEDGNLNASAPDTLQVTVQSLTTNDTQMVTLTETGNATMTFRNTTPLATATGVAVAGDSIIQMQALENLRATYTDSKDAPDTITYLLFDSPIPALTSSASATATVGQGFSFLVTAINSPWSFGATGLPAPLTINSSTGQISGTPTTPGSYPVTLTATNPAGTGMQNFTLTVNPAVPVVTSSLSATVVQGTAITTYQINASNSPTSFSASGLPAGLSVNTSTGAITGTPSVSGSFSVTIGASNVSGTGTATLNLLVHPPTPVITSSLAASGTVGVAFSYQITASNTPTGFAASGLPAGLSFNAGSGVISGTPTVAGISSISLSASNGGGTGTATLVLSLGAGAPLVGGVAPANGSTAGGTVLTITGANLATSTGVTVGGVAATTLLIDSPTQIRCTTPPGAAGTVDVVVTTTTGSVTATGAFTYQTPAASAPVISSVSPASGPTAGGTALTLSGQNFTGTTALSIAGSAVAFSVVNDTTITCTTVAHAAGAVDVVVTTPAGSTTATSAYTYVDPAAEPEADLSRGGTPIANGGTDAIGFLNIGQPVVITYSLANTGAAVLTTGGSVGVSGLVGCTIGVTILPPTSVLVGNQASFAVAVTPTATTWSCVLALATNDSTENPYTWTISGTAAVVPSPDMQVFRGAIPIAVGSSDVLAGTVAGSVATFTYTVNNAGTAALLVIPPSPLVANVWNCTLDSLTSPLATIATGSSSDLVLNIRPTAAGLWTAQVVLSYNDTTKYPYLWSISGTASAAPLPELDLMRGATPIATGGNDNLGATGVAGVAVPLTYTLTNSGVADLTISGSPTLSAQVNCVAVVTTPPAATVVASATDTCALAITPTAAGAWSVQVSVVNNDSNENPYVWTISGTATSGPSPELDIARAATPITAGGTDPVGLIATGSATTLTYTLANTGATVLNVDSGVTLGALVNCSVAVTDVPATTVSSGSNTTLALAITPSGSPWSFAVAVVSNDSNESPYTWTVDGTALAGVAPELDVSRGGTPLADGGTDSVAGTVAGTLEVLTFTLTNTGNALLAIQGAPLVGSASNCTAVVTTAPTSSIAAAGSSNLVLSVTPTAAGPWSVAIAVESTDANENPYNWTVAGTATAALVPELDLSRGGTPLADLGTDAVVGTVAGTTVTLTYTLTNSGTAALTVQPTPVITAPVNCFVVVSSVPTTSLGVAATDALVLDVTPTAAGAWSVGVALTSTDSDESPYDWTISGTAAAAAVPEIELAHGATAIADGGADSIAGTVAGTATAVTYTLSNIGAASLSIQGAPALAALTNCTVAVVTNPAATIVSSGNSNTVLSITPTAAGAWSVSVAVANTDSDENPYDWTIGGTATAALVPELDLSRGGTAIAVADSDVVGGTMAGTAVALTYTLTNSGSANLAILGAPIIGLPSNCTVTLTTAPAANIAAAGTSDLVLSVTPTVAGAWSVGLSIANTDANEGTYGWTISGAATAPPVPELDVARGATVIVDGGTDAVTGTFAVAATPLTYTLSNTGAATLTTSGTAAIGSLVNCAASVVTVPAASVVAGDTTTVVVSVTPAVAGPWSFVVSVANNDSNEGPYDWTVNGTAGPAGGGTGTGSTPSSSNAGGGPSCGAGGALGLIMVSCAILGIRRSTRPGHTRRSKGT